LRSSQIGESFKVRPGHFNSLVRGHTAFSKGDTQVKWFNYSCVNSNNEKRRSFRTRCRTNLTVKGVFLSASHWCL